MVISAYLTIPYYIITDDPKNSILKELKTRHYFK